MIIMAKIPYDKKLHFLAGAIIALIAIVVTSNFRIGLAAGFIAGVAKEIYDQITYGGFDIEDMIATWLGCLCAVGILFINLVWGRIPIF